MIKIKRSQCPQVLQKASSTSNTYRNEKVVESLWNMQNEKCCYCERKLPKSGHAKAVEHFHPRSVFKYRKNDWENLLLACSQCNGLKSNKFPTTLTDDLSVIKVLYQKRSRFGTPLIIDPSALRLDPENHIGFVVDPRDSELFGLVFAKKNSRKGIATIDAISLNSDFYIKERNTYIMDTLFDKALNLLRAHRNGLEEQVETHKDSFKIYMSATSQFAALARAFCRDWKFDKDPINIEIPVGYDA